MLYILWDLKLKVGHSSRTVKDCVRLGREDITIRTALLEHRFIAGDAAAGRGTGRHGSGPSCSATPAPSSSRQAGRAQPTATSGRADSAMWWSRTSRRARAACATCRRSTGSASTSTGCRRRRAGRRGPAQPRGIPTASPGRGFPLGGALPPALHHRPRRGPADLRPAGARWPRGWAIADTRRAGARSSVFMQDYFRQATRVGELTAHLPDPAREPATPRPARPDAGMFRAPQACERATSSCRAASTWPTRRPFLADPLNLLRDLRRGAADGLSAPPERDAPDRAPTST